MTGTKRTRRGLPEAVPDLPKEHLELEQEIADWRRWWSELCEMGEPHFGEMGDRLEQFRTHLLTHFQHEELHSPLAGPVPPHSMDAVAGLWQDHADLLAELDLLIRRLHACGPDVGCWGDARRDFEAFLEHLFDHEAREQKVLGEMVHGELA